MAANLVVKVDAKNIKEVKEEIKKLKQEIRRLKKGFLMCKTCKHKKLITIECKIDDCRYERKNGN